MAATLTIEQAQEFLKENPHAHLNVRYFGENRRMFYNSELDAFGLFYPNARRSGHTFLWEQIQAIFAPARKKSPEEARERIVNKYRKKASLASFANAFIRKCLAADPSKSVYENGLSTGVPIEGDIITLKAVGKTFPWIERDFRAALRERRPYHSGRHRWRGYDLSLDLEPVLEDDSYNKKGDVRGYLNLEYKDCGNGRYYLLVNDDEFIGYDID